MAPPLLFSQLLLVALVLIGLLTHVWWLDKTRATPQSLLTSAQRWHTRSKEPQPFTGYIHKPFCEVWAQGGATRLKAPRSPPPLITCTRGRRCTVDPRSHCCPAPDCSYYGRRGRGNLRSTGHPGGQPWRPLQGVVCHGYVYATHGTLFQGQHASAERIGRGMACLAEGLGMRGPARVVAIAPNTVLHWGGEATAQLTACAAYLLPELHVNQVQLDALYAVLRALRDGDMSAAQAIERLARSPPWVWTAREPESELLRSVPVGDRTRARAPAGLPQLAPMWAPGCGPLFVSDGYAHDLPALVPHCGYGVPPPQRQGRGPVPQPRWRPRPAWLYAQVVKTRRRRRLSAVKHRVVFGTQRAIAQVLTACGGRIHTAFVERLNVSLRQRGAALGRRRATPCQSAEGWRQPLALFPV